jgi:hypothetical protein
LKRTSRRIEKFLPSIGKKVPDNDEAIADVTASALTLLTALAKPARLGKVNLHPYRLEVGRIGGDSKNGARSWSKLSIAEWP